MLAFALCRSRTPDDWGLNLINLINKNSKSYRLDQLTSFPRPAFATRSALYWTTTWKVLQAAETEFTLFNGFPPK